MTDLRKTVKCANCGAESAVYVNSELDVREVMFSGRCRCGSTMQVSYSIVGASAQPESQQKSEPSSGLVNIDESLFPPEIPSDALRDIMED
ncbi:MAG: hypothetical protein AB1324_05925 [Candidatus Micrarchaeota archaeon]